MSKAHRGKGLRQEQADAARGTCPITKQTGVKLLFDHEADGNKMKISKVGKATLANAKKDA